MFINQPPSERLNYYIPPGLVGNGVADDGPAINAALATGKAVFLPKPSVSYFIGTPIVTANVIGQRLMGEDQSVQLTADDSVTKIISLSARSQQVENMHIRGTGIADGQSGLYIGPFYVPYWKADRLLIDDCAIGIENKCPSSNPDAYASDAGGVYDCQISGCEKGILCFGNQDDTPIIGTSFLDCTVAGVYVEGGGATILGGVFGNCNTSIIVAGGNCTSRNIHHEPGASNSGYVIDVEANSTASIFDSALQNAADPTIVAVRGAANSKIDLYGTNGNFVKGRSNGTAIIRQWGGIQGQLVVDYNGDSNYEFRAGPYDYVDTALPTAAVAYVGRTMLLLNPNAKELHTCSQTGAGTYAWT